MYDHKTTNQFTGFLSEINDTIDLLYITPCTFTRNMLLYRLRTQISSFVMLANGLINYNNIIPGNTQPQLNQPIQREFTLEELAQYNGKNGNPAYVAVNGVVYDVTNNAAWAAASHFGLTAGKDLTSEFASCHASQAILNQLTVVGKLLQ